MVILHTCGLSARGAKDSRIKRKRATILPISIVQSFFCVLFFSLCSNLSIWPGRQVVPDESRCYIPIFDGLVWIVNVLPLRGLTPLHCASKRGHVLAILLLAAAGADKAAQDEDGLSAVHHATLGNRLAALVTLIQLGAPTNLRSKAGRTPLAQARHDDHEELVSLVATNSGAVIFN